MKRSILVWALGAACAAGAAVYDVRDFGAAGDGRAKDTAAVQRAVDAAHAAGGGTVEVPAGTYVCGSIFLRSHVDFHVGPGAEIRASADPADYNAPDVCPQNWTSVNEAHKGGHLFLCIEQENVTVRGPGRINGNSRAFLVGPRGERWGQGSVPFRPAQMLYFVESRDVRVQDLELADSSYWSCFFHGCEQVSARGLWIHNVRTGFHTHNGDGIDIDCCRFTTVSNCKINTPHDDALVLKSSYALKRPVVCENILIANCLVTGYKVGTVLDATYVPEKVNWVCGRIKLGTESNGGYRNITITGCNCFYSSGLAFEEVDQGKMENIMVSNISMSHVHHYPIYITTGCRNRGPKERTDVSSARDIQISNVTIDDCDSLSGIQITGMPGYPIENIRLSNIQIRYRGGVQRQVPVDYPELGTKYPEPAKFLGTCPAYGLFARHVRGLQLSHVTFMPDQPDSRPSIITTDVEGLVMDHVDTPDGLGSR